MLLGEFRDLLDREKDDAPVMFDTGQPVGHVISWRGVYAEASLDTGQKPRTVSDLRKEIDRVLAGEERTAWKGGEYSYARTTPLWADKAGDYDGRVPTGVRPGTDRCVIVTTTVIPDEYR
jgi:hypothetical protein